MLCAKLLIGPKYLDGVLPLLAAARESIEIIMFEWRVYEKHLTHPVTQLNAALAAARARGVTVRVLMMHDNTREYLHRQGIETRRLYRKGLVHAKTVCIDRCICIIGSHNFTQAAFTRNLELSAVVDSIELGEAFSEYFSDLWGV